MTRAEVMAQYAVDANGTIVSPGKFEGEPLYAPHFWELALEGDGDEVYDNNVGRYVSIIRVEPWDRVEYPELGEDDVNLIQIHEDDQGFVRLEVLEDPELGKEDIDEPSEGGQDGLD